MKSGVEGRRMAALRKEDLEGLVIGRVKVLKCTAGPERGHLEGLVETRRHAECWTQYRGNARL